jgi:hypothetical protein
MTENPTDKKKREDAMKISNGCKAALKILGKIYYDMPVLDTCIYSFYFHRWAAVKANDLKKKNFHTNHILQFELNQHMNESSKVSVHVDTYMKYFEKMLGLK